MIVDSHAHIYCPHEDVYPPIDDPLRPPPGVGSPDHLRREMQTAGVDRALLVQTSTFYGWDNSFVRDTAEATRDWSAGVCTLDPEDPHSPDVLFALVSRSNIRALRTYPVRLGTQYDHPGNRRLFAAARSLGIVVNALVSLETADELAGMVQEYSDLPVVLDHCLALQAGPKYEATVASVIELAQHPTVHAKLTFLPTGSVEEYPFGDLHEACLRFIEAYGPERCLWGSDFPTKLWCPKVSYSDHLKLFRQELGLTVAEQEAILGGTAERLYFPAPAD